MKYTDNAKGNDIVDEVEVIALIANLKAQLAASEAKIKAIITWLDKNEKSVWTRGLWDAIGESK